jgi:pimeloyl-ACP methyl ester carboxylesterase
MARQEATMAPAGAAPIWGELRYSGELARLLADGGFRAPSRLGEAAPVMLIPGFMAGDASLAMLRGWLRRRGHRVAMSGIRVNVGCSERIVSRLQRSLSALAREQGSPVVLIGQSRGGSIARSLAVRDPASVSQVIMLGTPITDYLAVAPAVRRTVRSVALLGDLGVPRLLSNRCHEGQCCAGFRADLGAPLDPSIRALSVYSRSDAVVDWRATLDPHAEVAEVDSSHCGMSVHPAVYRILGAALDAPAAAAAPAPARRAA